MFEEDGEINLVTNWNLLEDWAPWCEIIDNNTFFCYCMGHYRPLRQKGEQQISMKLHYPH